MCERLVGGEEQAGECLLHLREQNQRKLIQIMPGDFQHFIKSQACKSYALFCELADMKKSQKITFTTALAGG